MRALYEAGVPLSEIAEAHGTNRNTIVSLAFRKKWIWGGKGHSKTGNRVEPIRTTHDRLDELHAMMDRVLAQPVRRVPNGASSDI